jgi:hypothetical protein
LGGTSRQAGRRDARKLKIVARVPPHLRQVVRDDDRVAEQLNDDAGEAEALAAARTHYLDDLGRAAEEAAGEHCVAQQHGHGLSQATADGGADHRGGRGSGRGRSGRRRDGERDRGRRAQRGAAVPQGAGPCRGGGGRWACGSGGDRGSY